MDIVLDRSYRETAKSNSLCKGLGNLRSRPMSILTGWHMFTALNLRPTSLAGQMPNVQNSIAQRWTFAHSLSFSIHLCDL